MDTLDALVSRKSIRRYKKEQIKENELTTILDAAGTAPVAMGSYGSVRLTVIQNKPFLQKMSEKVKEAYPKMPTDDPLHGVPTLVVVSGDSHKGLPNAEYMNAACILENMMIAATDIGLGSVFMVAPTAAFKDADLLKALNLPDGFRPIAAAGFGYSDEPAGDKEMINVFETAYIR